MYQMKCIVFVWPGCHDLQDLYQDQGLINRNLYLRSNLGMRAYAGRPGEESEPPKFLGQAKAWLPRDEKFDKLKDKSFKAKSVLDILPKFILKPMDEFSQLSDVALLYKTSLERVRGIFAYWAPFGYLLSWLLAPLPGVITGEFYAVISCCSFLQQFGLV